jgi:hypothetical protein
MYSDMSGYARERVWHLLGVRSVSLVMYPLSIVHEVKLF